MRLWSNASMSQETFAAHIGMKRSGLFRLLRPGVHAMFSDNFNRLAKGLEMTPHQLKEQIAVSEVLPSAEFREHKPDLSGVSGPPRSLTEVPRLHSISAGTRHERQLVEQGTIRVPQEWGDFVVRVDGLSMLPAYPDQSTAAFKVVQGQQLVFGKDYLIWFTNGECYFSSVVESDDDCDVLVLRKLNPDRRQYPDRRIHRSEIERVARCVGVFIDRS